MLRRKPASLKERPAIERDVVTVKDRYAVTSPQWVKKWPLSSRPSQWSKREYFEMRRCSGGIGCWRKAA